MEDKIAYLNMIQAVIARLASNSFLLKGWSVTLVSAMLALAAKDGAPKLVILALFPASAFWLLDGYFVWKEAGFRALYNRVRKITGEPLDFDMAPPEDTPGLSWSAKTFSTTLLLFHGAVVGLILIATSVVRTP